MGAFTLYILDDVSKVAAYLSANLRIPVAVDIHLRKKSYCACV